MLAMVCNPTFLYVHFIAADLPMRGPSPNFLSNTDMAAASVHGQLGPVDAPMRRPMRLEALPTGKPKKGKKKHNTLEPL